MTTSLVDNGVNVEALLGAREVFADAPQAAQFQWRSTVSWVTGTHSRTDDQTFFGFGEAAAHGQPAVACPDHHRGRVVHGRYLPSGQAARPIGRQFTLTVTAVGLVMTS